ncbi:D-methionine transport system ATP-binding protein [Melghirimyces profundicolus]|uniref:D-methionine transport system ATP-binding protein n=1 Tax=Melghirimyces profundicolus TaxID=1242148 RepID=A0A2T6C2T8_9BACL|nr:D-methionine transport system ATP-binding protein [Melghirimyces profundicolus]
MIQLKDIGKTYPPRQGFDGVTALEGVNLTIEKGDIFGIIGRSGAGKSTLLRLVNGLESPTSGQVWVDGEEITRLEERDLRFARQKIGMIFQHFNLLWSRTVWENVAFPLEVAGKSKTEIKRKVDGLLERVGLTDRANAYPSQLSGGQKQRVGIARALANDPKVLLCDEATSALDPETTTSILKLLKEINRETGITLLLITHEMSVVRSICHRVAVMEEGRVIEKGTVKEVFRNPVHPLTRQLVHQTEEEGEGKGLRIRCEAGNFPALWHSLRQAVAGRQVTVRVLEGELNEDGGIVLVLEGDLEQAEKALREAAPDWVEEGGISLVP